MGLKRLYFHNRTPIFDGHLVQRGSKSKYHKDARLTEIGLRLQVVLTIALLSTTNTLRRRTPYI